MEPEKTRRPDARRGSLTPGEVRRLRALVARGFHDSPAVRSAVALRILRSGDLEERELDRADHD